VRLKAHQAVVSLANRLPLWAHVVGSGPFSLWMSFLYESLMTCTTGIYIPIIGVSLTQTIFCTFFATDVTLYSFVCDEKIKVYNRYYYL
jgi:hypothetical protein